MSSEVNESLSSEVFLNQDTKSQHNMSKKPTLQPKESTPLIETYMLKKDGRVCVMARFGMEFVVKEDKVEPAKSQRFFFFSLSAH